MVELLNDPEFQKYRVKEVEEGIQLLRELSVSERKVDPEYFYGAMDMLKRIFNVPVKLVNPEHKSTIQQALALRAQAMDVFEAKMVRRFVEE